MLVKIGNVSYEPKPGQPVMVEFSAGDASNVVALLADPIANPQRQYAIFDDADPAFRPHGTTPESGWHLDAGKCRQWMDEVGHAARKPLVVHNAPAADDCGGIDVLHVPPATTLADVRRWKAEWGSYRASGMWFVPYLVARGYAERVEGESEHLLVLEDD